MKWKGNKLPKHDLNCVDADFSSKNCPTVTDDCAQTRVQPDNVKLLPFQDVEEIEFEDICDDNIPDLDIQQLCAIAALQSGPDCFEKMISIDIILTIINSITFQPTTLAEKSLERSFIVSSRQWKPGKTK